MTSLYMLRSSPHIYSLNWHALQVKIQRETRALIAPILHFYSKRRVHAYLDSFIGICNERNEETEHHIDEQTDERVEVDPTE